MENGIGNIPEAQPTDTLARVRFIVLNPGCRPECNDCVHQLDLDVDPSPDNPCAVFVADLADDCTLRPVHSYRDDGSIECAEHLSRQTKGDEPGC